jgi:hypothetical protein
MRLRPAPNLRLREGRRIGPVPDLPFPRQQLGQIGTVPEPAAPAVQSLVDGQPCFPWRVQHGPGLALRPLSGTRMVSIGSGQDLLLAQTRQSSLVPGAAVLGQELGQGGATA